MNTYDLLSADNHAAWDAALALCGFYDTYHLASYHKVAESNNEGIPYLFFFQKNGAYTAFPFLKRKVSDVPGLESCPYFDATSVYGYPGVLSSMDVGDIQARNFLSSFQKALMFVFKEMNIVSAFSRLNPLIQSSWLLEGLFDIIPLGNTVAINLAKPENEQKKGMTKNHLRDIKKAKTLGIIVKEDKKIHHLDDFIAIYNETMLRNKADLYYFFPKEYYLKLKREMGSSLKMFIAQKDEAIVCAAMFLCTDKIIQYHLSGTPTQYLHYSGLKLILDEVRHWGTMNKFSWLHLGGGVGACQDSLFHFKAGFSKYHPEFKTACAIIDPDIYQQLVEQNTAMLTNAGDSANGNSFFPQYRRRESLAEFLCDDA